MSLIENVLSNLLYNTDKFCSICLNILDENVVRIHDDIFLDGHQTLEKVHQILSYVLGNEVLSYMTEYDTVCGVCTQSAIASYKFIKMCKHNTESMHNVLEGLANCIEDQADSIEHYKTVAFVVNTKDTNNIQYYDRRKISRKLTVLRKIQPTIGTDLTYLDSPMDIQSGSQISIDENFKMHPKSIPSNVLTNEELREFICSVYSEENNKRFHCNFCSVNCGTYSSIERHYLQFHNPTPENGNPIKSKKELKAELRNKICNAIIEDGKEIYECKICETQFKKYSYLHDHFTQAHGVNDLESKPLIGTLKFENMYTLVTDTDDGVEKYQCDICWSLFTDIAELQSHQAMCNATDVSYIQATYSEDYDATCEPVMLVSETQEKDDIYSVIDVDGLSKYKCGFCSRIYRKFCTLQIHAAKYHNIQIPKRNRSNSGSNPKQYICITCGKSLKCRNSLKVHELKHNRESVTCPTCNKVYNDPDYFKRYHICDPNNKRVRPPKKFTCDICKKLFSTKESIRAHIRYEHLAPGILCSWCGKKFPSQVRLNDHIVVHTKEKNFKCDECPGVFVCKAALKKHKRIHSGEKPYPCLYCDLKFLSSSRRNDHTKRKHMEPSEKCEVCGKVFRTRQVRLKHTKRHFNPKSILYVHKEKVSENVEIDYIDNSYIG